MCWIEEGVQILPLTVKFAEMALFAEEARMREALWGAIETLQRSGKRIVDSMRCFMADYPLEATELLEPSNVDETMANPDRNEFDEERDEEEEEEEEEDGMEVDERDYSRDEEWGSRRVSPKGSAKPKAKGRVGGGAKVQQKAMQPDWWKGLTQHDGDTVQCRSFRGILRVSESDAKVECDSEASGARVLLTLSAFEIASGHGGKNARRSIKLVASGLPLGDAAASG